jgi:hypothetical protein
MRVLALFLFGVVAGCVNAPDDQGAPAAGDSGPWLESSKVYATVANASDASIIAEGDAALAPLGFHRDSKGTTYPGNLVPGIFASYKAGNSVAAMIVEGSRPGCIVFAATNYDVHSAGLVKSAAAAIEARFRKSFGNSLTFFSDSNCSHAL